MKKTIASALLSLFMSSPSFAASWEENKNSINLKHVNAKDGSAMLPHGSLSYSLKDSLISSISFNGYSTFLTVYIAGDWSKLKYSDYSHFREMVKSDSTKVEKADNLITVTYDYKIGGQKLTNAAMIAAKLYDMLAVAVISLGLPSDLAEMIQIHLQPDFIFEGHNSNLERAKTLFAKATSQDASVRPVTSMAAAASTAPAAAAPATVTPRTYTAATASSSSAPSYLTAKDHESNINTIVKNLSQGQKAGVYSISRGICVTENIYIYNGHVYFFSEEAHETAVSEGGVAFIYSFKQERAKEFSFSIKLKKPYFQEKDYKTWTQVNKTWERVPDVKASYLGTIPQFAEHFKARTAEFAGWKEAEDIRKNEARIKREQDNLRSIQETGYPIYDYTQSADWRYENGGYMDVEDYRSPEEKAIDSLVKEFIK